MPCPVTGCENCLCYQKTDAYSQAVKYVDVNKVSSTLNASWRNEDHLKCMTESMLKNHDLTLERAHDDCKNALNIKYQG